MKDIRGYRVLVVGLGKSGISASRLLLSKGAKVTATDSRPFHLLSGKAQELKKMGVEIEAGGHRDETFLSSDLIVLSPGISSNMAPLCLARQKGIPVIGEMEFACRYLESPLIAITGSNGKSTTTTLISNILTVDGRKVFTGGNIGIPISEYILTGQGCEYAVVEVSSFQLETIETFKPFISILLNISPDHMDRYRDLNDYAAAKYRIFENQSKDDYAILNKDEWWCEDVLKNITGKTIMFSRKREVINSVYIHDGWIIASIDNHSERICPVSEIRIMGVHNLENILASICAAIMTNCNPESIVKILQEFPGLEHRLEFVREVGGVKYINDSKGTNTGAVIKSLESFTEPVILIAGGKDKGGDFSLLRPLVKEKVKMLILIGESKDKIYTSLGDLSAVVMADSLDKAVNIAHKEATRGDVILLSPGCASFDMFENFEERGRLFKEIVWNLPGQ